MTDSALNREESFGLAIALAAHVALGVLLALRPPSAPTIPPPERMTVTLSEDVGLTSTAPSVADPAPDEAPELGQAAPEPARLTAPPPRKPVPKVHPKPEPKVQPKPAVTKPKPAPTVAARPLPQPSKAATPPKAAPKTTSAPKATSTPKVAPKGATSTARAPNAAATQPAQAGGSRIGNDFLKGVSGASGKQATTAPPAATVGPAVRSALAGAISRQLKPKWSAPQGIDAELLVTVLSWDLNPDGTLAGSPRVVRQDGITAANRAQAQRHAEQAIRAVRLAAPFNLPPEFYPAWKRVSDFRFDRKLSQ
jgi:outer membrane biosynthesis protein TonB